MKKVLKRKDCKDINIGFANVNVAASQRVLDKKIY